MNSSATTPDNLRQNPTILIFIDWYLPGYNAGGPVRSMANLADHLSNEFHFKIVTRNNDYQDQKPYENIIPGQWTKIQENIECCYLSPVQVKYSFIKNLIKSSFAEIIYINGIYSFYFSVLPLFLAKRLSGKKIIVAPRGMLADSAIGVKKIKKSSFLLLAKLSGLYRNIIFHATNEKEALQVKKIIGKKTRIHVADNFPKKIRQENPDKKTKTKGNLHLVSIARVAPEKNTLYALEILNKINKGNILFDIYGSVYNREYWGQCLDLIKTFSSGIVAEYRNSVEPDHLGKIYRNADFLFLPTRGENFGHSILESLIEGTPVIISDQTPWRNLQNTAFGPVGWDISLNHPGKFVEIIEYCSAMDQEEYNRMSRAAYAFAKQIINDPETMEANRKLFSVSTSFS